MNAACTRRLAVGGLSALAGAPFFARSARAATTWNFYIHQSAPQFTTSRGAAMLTDAVKKATDDEFRIRLHLAGTLQIEAANMSEAVSQNIVQMGDDLFFSGSIPVAAMLRLPFLVQSYGDYDKAEAIILPEVSKAYAAKGVTVIAAYTYPNQYFWGRKPIGSLADFNGQKLRVVSPEQGEFIRKFGGVPVSLGAAEVPSALDRGVVDGLITGTVGADLWKDLLKYGYMLGTNFNNAYIIVNTAAFGALSASDQAALRKAAQDAAQWNTDTMKREDTEIVERLKKANFVIADPTEADRDKATASMKPYWTDWAKSKGPEVVATLDKVRAALGH